MSEGRRSDRSWNTTQSSKAGVSLLRSIIRRVGDSITACVTNGPPCEPIVTITQPNFFTNDQRAECDNDQINDKYLHDFDPSQMLDHWLRELDSVRMEFDKNKPTLDYSLRYQRTYKRQRSMIDINSVEDSELLEILDDLSDLELQLEQEIEIVQKRQEEAQAELALKEKIKAENIQIAIEKIKEASIKKMYIKVFTSDGCAKSLLVDETMTVAHVTRILFGKHLIDVNPLWALVELAPDLHLERVYEDHELLVENCLLWKPESKNTLWFMVRPEKYDVFQRPQEYFTVEYDANASKQELFDKYFNDIGRSDTAPLEVTGNVWIKTGAKKSWKKQFCVLKPTGLFTSTSKSSSDQSSLIQVATFDVHQVYYGVNWEQEYKSPTQFCFAIKHPQIQVRNCRNTKYFCVESEMELHRWVTGIRMIKNGAQICDNYRDVLEDMENMDKINIEDDMTRNYSELKYVTDEEKLLTPTSDTEQRSFDSGVSSRAASDISEIKTKIIADVHLLSPLSGYTSDFEEEDLPPPPTESMTSLHCPESFPPPPLHSGTTDTLLIISGKNDRIQNCPNTPSKEQKFKTFFEDVWFEEGSYQA